MSPSRRRAELRMDQPLDRGRIRGPSYDPEQWGRLSERIARFIGSWRFIAWMTVVIVAWLRGRRSAHRATRASFHALLAMTGAQIVLGIWAVLTLAALPVALAHQVGAVVLWVLVIRARHMSLYPRAGSIREGTA